MDFTMPFHYRVLFQVCHQFKLTAVRWLLWTLLISFTRAILFCFKPEENEHERYTHTFACEICGDKFKTLDDLETHMHTCEKFDCDRCQLELKTLCEIKNHCKSKHRNGADIFNFKYDRENPRKVTQKEYNSKDL